MLAPDWGAIRGDLAEVAAYLEANTLTPAEVFVRGSAARGELRVGVSDLDFVILVDHDRPLASRTASWKSGAGPWSPTECELYTIDELSAERFWYVEQMLCLESVHASGPRLHEPRTRIRFGPNLKFYVRVVDARIASLDRDGFKPSAAAWVAKSLIRAAFETVMEDAGGYTREIAACCRAIEDVFPLAATHVWELAESFVAGLVTRAQILDVYELFQDRIESTLRIGSLDSHNDIRQAKDKIQ